MCKLDINLISNRKGITILQADCDHTIVKYSPAISAFAYEWKLGSGPVAEHFMQAAKLCMSPEHCFMTAVGLHCMSYFSSQGPDDRYEETWYCVKNDVKCKVYVLEHHICCAYNYTYWKAKESVSYGCIRPTYFPGKSSWLPVGRCGIVCAPVQQCSWLIGYRGPHSAILPQNWKPEGKLCCTQSIVSTQLS